MNEERLDKMLEEMWDWVNGPGRDSMSMDPNQYARSFDRVIQLEQLKAMYTLQASIDRIASAFERAYPRHPTKR